MKTTKLSSERHNWWQLCTQSKCGTGDAAKVHTKAEPGQLLLFHFLTYQHSHLQKNKPRSMWTLFFSDFLPILINTLSCYNTLKYYRKVKTLFSAQVLWLHYHTSQRKSSRPVKSEILRCSVCKQKMRGAEGRAGRGKDGCPDAPAVARPGPLRGSVPKTRPAAHIALFWQFQGWGWIIKYKRRAGQVSFLGANRCWDRGGGDGVWVKWTRKWKHVGKKSCRCFPESPVKHRGLFLHIPAGIRLGTGGSGPAPLRGSGPAGSCSRCRRAGSLSSHRSWA